MKRIIAIFFITAIAGGAAVNAVEKISVNGLFKDKAILVIDGKQRLLRSGETSPEGVKLIRANSREAVIEVDGVQSTRGLGTHIGSGFAEPESRVVQVYPVRGNMYSIVGSINGFPVNFIVDTGATFVSLNEYHARRLGIDFAVEGRPAVSQTASGMVKIYLVKLKRVKVGEIELTEVEGSVHEGAFPTEVLLGMSFLGRLDIKREGGVMELRKKY